jgi:DNA primase
MFSRATIDNIFSTARIEEVIGEYVSLKKRGANYIGLCPFHSEKTPSFNVSPAKELFKCFGCGKAGNVVGFLMDHEKFTYPEALKFLAQKYNITIEEVELSKEGEEDKDEIASIFIVLAYAQKYFHEHLLNSDEGHAIGMAYFKTRGFTRQTIEKFQLGFSPSGRDTFSQHAIRKGYNEKFLIAAGLTIKTDDGKLIDRFRERAMFPIHSAAGRTVGFGARILNNNPKEAKYINSPDTKVFNKGQLLYGLNLAKDTIRKSNCCYLVEGYTDVISMHQSGIENVVASLGTSLTDNHTKLIKRHTNNLSFIFDGDEAGIKASIRGIDIALKDELNLQVLVLPDNEDPDSFCRKNNPVDVSKFIKNNSEDFILFKSKLLLKGSENDPIQRSQAINSIILSISFINNRISRATYINELSKKFNIPEDILHSEVNRALINKFQSKLNISHDVAEKPRKSQKNQYTLKIPIEQEREIIKILITKGNEIYYNDITVADYLITRIGDSEWEDQNLKEIYNYYYNYFLEQKSVPEPNIYIRHSDLKLQNVIIEFIDIEELVVSSKWQSLGRDIPPKDIKREVDSAILHFQLRKFQTMKTINRKKFKGENLTDEEKNEILTMDKFISDRIVEISKELSITYI